MIASDPLLGVRVLELAEGKAAAATGRALADLGADVVKVEPPSGSTMRQDPRLFEVFHAGKRSISIAVGQQDHLVPLAAAELDCLLVDAQQWSAPMDRLNSSRNLVVLIFDDHRDADASSIWHASGQSAVDAGHGEPLAPPGHIPFYDTAMTALFAFLTARWAGSTGGLRPIVIRLNTEDVELTHGRLDLTRAANGQVPPQKDPFLALFIQCRDGEVASHVNRAYWKTWTELVGRPELDDDQRFATMSDLLANRSEVIAELERWTLEHSRADVECMAQARGLPVGSLLTPQQVLGDPQLQHRGFVGPQGIPAFLPFMLADGQRWLPRKEAPPVAGVCAELPLWEDQST